MQKIIYFCLTITKIVREIVYLFIGLAVLGIIEEGGLDLSGKTSYTSLVISIVLLILLSYALPYFLKKKWPTEVANAQAVNDKPHKSFTWIVITVVLILILFLYFWRGF